MASKSHTRKKRPNILDDYYAALSKQSVPMDKREFIAAKNKLTQNLQLYLGIEEGRQLVEKEEDLATGTGGFCTRPSLPTDVAFRERDLNCITKARGKSLIPSKVQQKFEI